MNLASRIIVVSIIIYGWHRGIKLRVTRCLMVGVWLIIRRHNWVVDDAALLITVMAVKAARGNTVF